MELSAVWKIQHFPAGLMKPYELAFPGFDDRFWISAKVPGDVHSTLIERNIIDHPYFGHNDIKSRWIEDEEWWYRGQFNYEVGEKSDERHELVFEGLDTFSTVFVNGLEVGTTNNMLMAHSFDVTKIIRTGWNCIAVKFDPLRKHHEQKELFQWSSYTKERPWLRKAAMNFGWDWGPRMVTVGIWGKVRMERTRVAKLDSIFARTVNAGVEEAAILVDIDVKSYLKDQQLECEVTLVDQTGEHVADEKVALEGAVGTLDLLVKSPQLWWTHDLGNPYLYELQVNLFADGEKVDSNRQPFGIRTIELELKDENDNPSFAFLLNGIKIFAKGANWIPVDHFIGSAPDERYRQLIDLAVEGHMNMLRVWAGGIYEKDIFYDECDRRGVLIWQDFAFANALFPDFNRDFMDNVRKEVIYNVKRLRNHASLALWCGNNEIDWLYDMKSSSGDITTPFYGRSIYHELIPEVLEELDDSRAYWPSSPYGGNDDNDPEVGDRHNWQVWHGSVYPRQFGDRPLLDYSIEGVSFKNFKKDLTLFNSEFGMHASANRYTLEKNIPSGQFYWGSVEMAYRNKDTNHQKGILLMEGYTGIPQTIDEYMNFSMLTQAEGLKYGVEHYRRNKKRTSGTLIWQLNDSWPGTSWSMIDYELLPKASFYYARKFYHPLLLSLEHEPGEPLKLWAINDTLESYEGNVTIQVISFDGTEVYRKAWEATIGSNQAVFLGQVDEEEALNGNLPEQVVVKVSAEGFAAPDNLYYLRDPKDLLMESSQLEVVTDSEQQTVTVKAGATLARMVKIDLPLSGIRFSDNYFDLLPHEVRTIQISHRDGSSVSLADLSVSAFN
ncbi:MAG: glycoside hydrolase family 2 protein [Paenibacillus sp.]|nr:glycoside hydrolase family 2 protein [Paenibacillus sp.]